MKRTYYFFCFFLVFIWNFVQSNLKLANMVLTVSRSDMVSEFIEFDGSELTDTEAVILSYVISLTPGTITVDFTKKRQFIIHAVNDSQEHQTLGLIKQQLIPLIQRFTR